MKYGYFPSHCSCWLRYNSCSCFFDSRSDPREHTALIEDALIIITSISIHIYTYTFIDTYICGCGSEPNLTKKESLHEHPRKNLVPPVYFCGCRIARQLQFAEVAQVKPKPITASQVCTWECDRYSSIARCWLDQHESTGSLDLLFKFAIEFAL